MEEIMKNQPCLVASSPSPFSMRRDSHTISKLKPKIRIIHVFAPEIIKTDVANFRELVQRLTGKPPSDDKVCEKKPRRACRSEDRQPRPCKDLFDEIKLPVAKKPERGREGLEEEEETWNGANSGGFLGGFADLDGLIQELGQFPLLPMDTDHQMHRF